MKKIIFSLTLLLFVLTSFEQTNPDSEFSKDYYLKKSHSQRTTAWILLGAGVGMMVSGVAINASQPWYLFGPEPAGYNKNKGLWLFYLGGAVASTSIIFFLNAHHNKKRATTVAITNQKILWYQKNSVGFVTQPSFTIRIGL